MKYTNETIINLPLDKVVELFDSAENLSKWMEGLQSYEHLSGTPGQPGAKARLKFKMGGRDMEMIETITANHLPHELSGTYEMNGVVNTISNKFEKISENQTRYYTENEFKFHGFMQFVAFLMPGAFKRQSQKYLDAFKKFAESAG